MIAETKTLATIHTLRGNFRFEACAKLRSNDDVLTRRHRSAIAMCRAEEGCFEPTNVVSRRGRLRARQLQKTLLTTARRAEQLMRRCESTEQSYRGGCSRVIRVGETVGSGID